MAHKVEIAARNMEVTERISDYINKKTARLERLLPDMEETHVELSYLKSARNAGDRNVAQITIRGKGYILRAEERSSDVFAAIDAALDKMQRQIERFKGKRDRGRGDGLSAAEVAKEILPVEPQEQVAVIVRRKTFTLVPMDEGEAIEQMRLLGHENFFVFYNANTSAINILYVRRDGTFGLIEPKLG